VFNQLQAVVLAAGKSTRFKTEKTKLVEKICGQEIIIYITRLLDQLNIPTTIIVGFQKELLSTILSHYHDQKIQLIEQQQQLGTGHALTCSRNHWNKELILVLNSDAPLITSTIIEKLYKQHMQEQATVSFVTAHHHEPSASYGRVITEQNIIRIVEANEFQGDAQEHCCINAGIYLINRAFLEEHLNNLEQNRLTNEFYITDFINIASKQGKKVTTVSAPFDQVRGINTLQELWAAEQIKRSELIKQWMDRGVRFAAAQSVHIDLDVSIGAGTKIGAGVHLLGTTTIGKDCDIGPYTIVENSSVESGCTIKSSCVISHAVMHKGSLVGPFAHVGEQTIIGEQGTIGNFVETKRTEFGAHSKAKHLTYLGDAIVGERVNIGAGTITCNYDGMKKHTTTIADDVLIGSNNSLVAPITIGAGSYTAAGSVITHDVPEEALAIARTRQINKLSYAHKLFDEIIDHEKDYVEQKKSGESCPCCHQKNSTTNILDSFT